MSGPRKSNSPQWIVRGIKSLKTFYWTNSRLRQWVLPFISTREANELVRQWRSVCCRSR